MTRIRVKPKPQRAPSAAPSNALRVWSDHRCIFVELPGPHIIPYPITEGGLSRALSLIRTHHYDFAGTPITKPPSKTETIIDNFLAEHGIFL